MNDPLFPSANIMQNWTDVATIEPAVAELRRTFLATHKTRALAWRKEQLTQLGFMIQDNEERFVAAVEADLGRPPFETRVAELEYLKGEVSPHSTRRRLFLRSTTLCAISTSGPSPAASRQRVSGISRRPKCALSPKVILLSLSAPADACGQAMRS